MKKVHRKKILLELGQLKAEAESPEKQTSSDGSKISSTQGNSPVLRKHVCDHPGCDRSFRSLDGLGLHQDQFHGMHQPPPAPPPGGGGESLMARSSLANLQPLEKP